MTLLGLLWRLPRAERLLLLWLASCGIAPFLFVLARSLEGASVPFSGLLPLLALALSVLGLAVFEPPRRLSLGAWRAQLARRLENLRSLVTSLRKESR